MAGRGEIARNEALIYTKVLVVAAAGEDAVAKVPRAYRRICRGRGISRKNATSAAAAASVCSRENATDTRTRVRACVRVYT